MPPPPSLPLVNISLLSTTVSLFSACFTARESVLAVQKELRSYSSQRWPLARRVQNKSSAPSAEATGSRSWLSYYAAVDSNIEKQPGKKKPKKNPTTFNSSAKKLSS